MKKIAKFVAVVFAVALVATCFTGCTSTTEPKKISSLSNSIVDVSEETSFESSVEQSKEDSSESSIERSLGNTSESKAEESSQQEISEEDSVETSDESSADSEISSPNEYTADATKEVSFDEVIRYGKITSDIVISGDLLTKGLLIGIVEFNDDTYGLYYFQKVAYVDASVIEMFPEDYTPDFSERIWFGFDKENLGLV